MICAVVRAMRTEKVVVRQQREEDQRFKATIMLWPNIDRNEFQFVAREQREASLGVRIEDI